MNYLNPLTVVLYFLCVARLTHLVVEDAVLDRPREWVRRRAHGRTRPDRSLVVQPWSTIVTIYGCAWCSSVYVAALVMAALALGLPDWCLAVPAASYVTGWLEMALGAMDDE